MLGGEGRQGVLGLFVFESEGWQRGEAVGGGDDDGLKGSGGELSEVDKLGDRVDGGGDVRLR